MNESEYHAGWLAGSNGQPCAFSASPAWLAGYVDGQRDGNGVLARRRYLVGARA